MAGFPEQARTGRGRFGYAESVISRLGLGLILALAIVACNEAAETPTTDVQADEQGSTATTAPPETVAETTTPPPGPEPGSIEAGRLVVIAPDGNIAIVAPDGSESTALTDDAGEALYIQPIWSPDSSAISFGEVRQGRFSVRIEDLEGDGSRSVQVPNNPFYMYWSPDGESIGVLHNGAQGLDFQMVDVVEGTTTVLGQGSPFYFSWSPKGDRVAVHVGTDTFETIALDGERSDLGGTAPGYLAPQWTPEGILHVVDGGLVLDDGADRMRLVDVGEPTMFVANEEGTLVAVQTLGPGGQAVAFAQSQPLEPNVVAVVATDTGDLIEVDPHPVVGLWWSPDGASLLLLVPASDGESLVAKVWSASEGLTEYATYRPSPMQVRDLFPFFPQYAQSMTFWAPDSSGFALAGEVGGEPGIWVQDLSRPVPSLVSEGLWVAWSP